MVSDPSNSTVPEPATYGALIGAAVLGIVLWKRWKTVSTGDISGS